MSKFKLGDRVRVTKPTPYIYGYGTVTDKGVRFDCYDSYRSDSDFHDNLDKFGLELVEPEKSAIDYNDGKWHGWNGGECPVHPKSLVHVKLLDCADEYGDMTEDAVDWSWDSDIGPIVAFRVVDQYVEPKSPREFWICNDHAYESLDDAKPYYGDEVIHVREVTE